ncbi:50S ribosomal protein L6 [Sodalis-like secondary symbiont of Drepanosiphum platanoidis]|uniref:50S ribosomal protein L6 n=1 Tax=Sodalis-like secondary symbiont of Drepanosiphum platanoidis TaxID=2994493 RepID=UPI003463D279
MSRISKIPIIIPDDIIVKIKRNNILIKKNDIDLNQKISKLVIVKKDNNILKCSPINNTKNSWAISGTTRSLLNNMIIGLTKGFIKKLKLIGIGYKASIKNKIIYLSLGFSHIIKYKLPERINIECYNQTEIIIKGYDKQVVGQVASDIRSYRPPEPYKGKGIRYFDEIVKIKETKKK